MTSVIIIISQDSFNVRQVIFSFAEVVKVVKGTNGNKMYQSKKSDPSLNSFQTRSMEKIL